jgi:hypothetical protein
MSDIPSSIIDSLVFSPESCPYGISYPEWTSKWWQWALSIPIQTNPIKDTAGEYSATNQFGPVWFLAGTVGGAVRRHCYLSSQRAILLPVLIHGGTLADAPSFKSEEELLSHARREMDIISNLEVIIDNVRIDSLRIYRVQTPVFDVVLPKENLFGGTPGATKGTSDGYWLFLKPLERGDHHIHSFGSCQSGRVKIGVDYDLTVDS